MFRAGRARAFVTADQAHILLFYDHHRVYVLGQLGVLITYPLMTLEIPLEDADSLEISVVFHESAIAHPPSPPEIQQLVASLSFSWVE